MHQQGTQILSLVLLLRYLGYQILLVVIVPLVVAFLTQFLLRKKYGDEKFNKSIKPKFPLFSILGVVLIIFTIMTLKAKILVKLNRPSEAIRYFQIALKINPKYPKIRGNIIHLKMQICEFESFEIDKNNLLNNLLFNIK